MVSNLTFACEPYEAKRKDIYCMLVPAVPVTEDVLFPVALLGQI
jgi:hypothetical protein